MSSGGGQTAVGAAELEHTSERIAAGFRARGVASGDVVLVRLPKGLRWLAAMRALHRIGAVSLPCPHMLTDADIADRMRRSGAVLALLEDADVPFADGPAPAVAGHPADPAFLLYTSGTEGPPKGALHPRGYLAANRLQAERWMGLRPGDRVWCTAAGGWSNSLRNVWIAAELCDAETVIHEGRFDAGERLELIAQLAPDVLCMSPTEYRMCARSADFERRPLPPVREAVAAGEALDAATIDAWRSAHGIRLRDGYGQTETGAVAGVCTGDSAPAGSLGRPLPGVETSIIAGELCVRAASLPTLFSGYWRDPAADRRAAARRLVAHRRSRPRGRARPALVRRPQRRRDPHRATASGPARWRRRCAPTRPCSRPPRSACPTPIGARSCTPTSSCAPASPPMRRWTRHCGCTPEPPPRRTRHRARCDSWTSCPAPRPARRGARLSAGNSGCYDATMVTLTQTAADKVRTLAAEDPDAQVLRVAVEGGGCSGFQYAIGFDIGRRGRRHRARAGRRASRDRPGQPALPAGLHDRLHRRADGRRVPIREPQRGVDLRLQLLVPGQARDRGPLLAQGRERV